MADYRIAAFLLLVGVAAAFVPWAASRARRQSGDQATRAFEALATRGFVVEQASSPRGTTCVRVWGLLAHPVSLDLRVAKRSRFVGAVTRGSGGMLDPLFEDAFRIVSSEPDRARLLLEPEVQQRLLRVGRVELRLGSFDSMLPREYSAGDDAALDRRMRALWMIRVPGKLSKLDAPDELGEIGRLVAEAVAKHCLPPGSPDRALFETGTNEAWI